MEYIMVSLINPCHFNAKDVDPYTSGYIGLQNPPQSRFLSDGKMYRW